MGIDWESIYGDVSDDRILDRYEASIPGSKPDTTGRLNENRKKYRGIWSGHDENRGYSASFSTVWKDWEFTESECEQLIKGEELNLIDYCSEQGVYGIRGRMFPCELNGFEYEFKETGKITKTSLTPEETQRRKESYKEYSDEYLRYICRVEQSSDFDVFGPQNAIIKGFLDFLNSGVPTPNSLPGCALYYFMTDGKELVRKVIDEADAPIFCSYDGLNWRDYQNKCSLGKIDKLIKDGFDKSNKITTRGSLSLAKNLCDEVDKAMSCCEYCCYHYNYRVLVNIYKMIENSSLFLFCMNTDAKYIDWSYFDERMNRGISRI